MEGLERHVPHDLEPTSLGALALQKFIDELFAQSDREVARIFNEHMGDDSEN